MINNNNNELRGYKFIDLFAGLGGFRLALESFGAECVFSSEWDEPVRQVYYENHNDLPAGDITAIDEKEIPEHNILCAGFPCQAFSISGKQRGFEDSRGTLFFDVARIVKEKRPEIVFLENVKNFAAHDNGNTLLVVKNTMEELGYDFYYKVLNASDYGVPQKRERIYMIGFRKDLGIMTFKFPNPIPLEKHVEDVLINDDKEVRKLVIKRSDTFIDKNDNEVQYSNKPIRLGYVNKGGQGERIYSVKGAAITLSAYGGGIFAKTGGYLINGETRKLHPRECARLMGFPETYIICRNANQAYKQFGNSVVIDVLQYILLEVIKAIQERKII